MGPEGFFTMRQWLMDDPNHRATNKIGTLIYKWEGNYLYGRSINLREWDRMYMANTLLDYTGYMLHHSEEEALRWG